MSDAIDLPAAEAAPAPGLLQRFWRHPVTQLFAKILFFALVAMAIGYLLRLVIVLPSYQGEEGMVKALYEQGATPWLRQLRSLLPSVLAYWMMVRLLERRKVDEFAPRKAPLHLPAGWLVGMGILLAAAGALALPGYYTVHGTHPDAPLLTPLLVLGIGAGVGEEIVARGILFRVVEECFGTWFALLFSAALFGLGHLGNPNSSGWMALAIAVEAGLLLGMAFAWTRSMWFVIALHAAWNFTQGPLLGIPVSGIAVTGLLDSTLQGPPALSGGRFGAEGSVITVAICLLLAGFFTHRAIAAGRIVRPFWRRRQPDRSIVVPRFEAGAPGLRRP
jgi:membrane protease YdiL (CAAX protease family)